MAVPRKRRRGALVWLVIGALAGIWLLDQFVLSRDARIAWMSRLPIGALRGLAGALPGDAAAQYALARQERVAGDAAGAVRAGTRAVQLDPEFLPAKAELANALIDAGRSTEAYAPSLEALSSFQIPSGALVAQGRLFARQREWARALECANHALNVDYGNPDAWLLLARAQLARRQWDEARSAAAQTLRQRPRDAEAWTVLSTTSLHAGDTAEAVRSGEQAVRFRPSNPGAQRVLGLALLSAPDATTAMRAEAPLREADRLDPGDGETQLGLGKLLVRQARWAAAETHLRQTLAGWPEVNETRALLAQTCRALGREAEARRWETEHARW
jgi:tetratricopeptide (TPR) repeat protein